MKTKVIKKTIKCSRCEEEIAVNSSKQNWRCKCGAVIKMLWDYGE